MASVVQAVGDGYRQPVRRPWGDTPPAAGQLVVIAEHDHVRRQRESARC